MADDGSAQGTVWPLPKFYFVVESNSIGVSQFQEIAGLDPEARIIEFRSGNSPAPANAGFRISNVTLKRGIFARENNFFDWYRQVQEDVDWREDITIRLLDEGGGPVMAWTLKNAWPLKVTATEAEGDEVAIETLEFAHEGLAARGAQD